MKNVFILNGHEHYPFSPGRLNRTLTEMAEANLREKGHAVKTTTMLDDYDVEEEVEKHVWADVVILQTPVNWMGVPWSCKKYMDLVYTGGIDGRLSDGDGRTRQDGNRQYGTGGSLHDRKYMLSLTFNAPAEAFENPSQVFFAGSSVDDLFLPVHLNFKFFGMTPLPTFACFDVKKAPQIEADLQRFTEHLDRFLPPAS